MKKYKVLITGVAGFIGSHTAELFLKKGYKVNGVDNLSTGNKKNLSYLKKYKNFKFLKNDLLKISNKRFYTECKFIIHFAGLGDIVPSIEYPKKYVDNNFNATLNLLELYKKIKIKKFVFAASSSCYGIAKVPTKETNKIDPQYPYSFSKNIAEQLVMHWGKIYKIPVNSIRIFNAYGTRSRTTGAYGAVMGVFLKQYLSKKPFTVVMDGNQRRDFIYVTDLAQAFFKASITKYSNKIWNVGSGNPKSIKQLCKIIDPNNEIIYIPRRPGEPKITHSNILKIKKDLNWKPKVNLLSGIRIIKKEINYWNKAPLWNKNNIKKATKLWFKYLD